MKRTLGMWIVSSLLFAAVGNAQGGQNRSEPRPIPAVDSLWTEELTWMEVRDAIVAGKTNLLIGSGGLEQNGPYVAGGKHNWVLQATLPAIARKLGNTLIAPVVKFVPEGDIDPPKGHMQYPGTVSLREETFQMLLTDIVSSYRQHGFKNIFMVADSGGNTRGMKTVAETLHKKWAPQTNVFYIDEYYNQDIWSFDYLKTIGIKQMPDEKTASRNNVHDDYHYESIIATVDPRHIRAEQRLSTGKFSLHGVDMRPLSKVIENGNKLVEYRAQITVDAIRKAMVSGKTP